ncbi:putative RNA-directed DNA polymerase, eukaryota, reverse transcriptase zinc-binding domain protein [Tanacetum coccineum]
MASLEKTKLLLFKVDFDNAFDSVNWCFLHNIMRQMGFGIKWRMWIDSCLSSVSISILVNGSPTKEFKMERGLRQGNPLSPFLFLVVAEALQIFILEACVKGMYKGLASGLKVNISKSRLIGVGVSQSEVNSFALSLGCASDSIHFIYLGLQVGKKMRYVDGWAEVTNRFRKRLSSWKANSLSIGGRLTLVKSVLGSLPIYYLSLFKAPSLVIDTLESIRRRFF